MKTIILLLTISLTVLCNSASCQETTGKFEKPLYKGQCAYATPNKDTLYVESNMYSLFDEIWDMPKNRNEKPVLVVVNDVSTFYGRKEE